MSRNGIDVDDSISTALDLQPAWEQRGRESQYEYAWFVRYAELGTERTLEKAARLLGMPIKGVREAARAHDWDVRAYAYDQTVVEITKAVTPSEDEALSIQYGAGMMMLKLGLSAIQIKNPALLKMKDIQALLQMGSEMVRRGAGVADLKVQHDVVQRVAEDIELLFGPDVIIPSPPEA